MELETGTSDASETGTTQEGVRTNNKARLMYYLDTVCSLLTLDEDAEIKRLRRYQEYSLSEYQIHRLLALCYLFKPSVLLDKCIFHSEDLCEKEANTFFDIRWDFEVIVWHFKCPEVCKESLTSTKQNVQLGN